MRADLHIHTTASDGCWTPEEVVRQVRAADIGLFAIADHDTMAHVPLTAQLAHQEGLAFLPGVEISALLNGNNIHILGYGIDPTDPPLNELLMENQERMEWLNDEILHRMKRAGHPIDLTAYASYQCDPSRGGWRSLNFLIDQGLCRDVRDFFDHIYIGNVRPPPPDFPHPALVAETVRAAGGLPVLAHPGPSLGEGRLEDQDLLPFVKFGIAGIECYASYHDDPTTQTCLAFCARHDLLITGGSDCHGGFVPRPLGVPEVRTETLQLGPLAARIIY